MFAREGGRRPALTVVDDGSVFSQSKIRVFENVRRQVKHLKFVTWAEVASVCAEICRLRRNFTRDQLGTVIAQDLARYLKEQNMSNEILPEIYLRDVSSLESVELYFKHGIYKCQSNFYNSASRNLYFAPYFTRQMAEKISEHNLVPVGEGISFISRVESVKVIEKRDVLAYLKEIDHQQPKEAAKIIRQNHRGSDVLIMRLGEPRLLFSSPVTKPKLNKNGGFGLGAMGSRSITLDELLAASQL